MKELVSRKMLAKLVLLKEEAIECDFELVGATYEMLEDNKKPLPARFF